MKEHLSSLSLTVAFFIFLVILGRAFFALTKVRMRGAACWLLSPAMGLAVLGLLSGGLNQTGLTVHAFGTMLVVILSVASVAILWWRKCRLPFRKIFISAAVVLLWLGTVGYPLLCYGGDWLSFVNDDFTNYCLGATRVLNHGFFDLPTESQLHGKDLPAIYWFMHVAMGARPVTDFVLAVVSAAGRTTPREAFMPVTLVFALAQAGALGGLLALSARFRKVSVPSILLLFCSPLFILGVYYQLFAQVGGLALLLLTLALLIRTEPEILWRKKLSSLLPCSVAIAALLWFYPECAPFALMPAGLMMLFALIRKPALRGPFTRWALLVSMLVIGLLHINTPMVVNFLALQVGHGVSTSTNSIFPYFLNKDALVRVVGWVTFFDQVPPRLWILALAIIMAAFVMLMRRCRILQGLACVALVMILMTFTMASKQNGFGLFKIAMFAQPVLVAGLVLLGHFVVKPKGLRLALAAGWVALSLPVSWSYQQFSLGQPGGPCETPFATKLGFPAAIKDKGACRMINMSTGQEKLVVPSLPDRMFDPIPLSFSALQWGGGDKLRFCMEEQHRILHMILPELVRSSESMNVQYYEPVSDSGGTGARFLVEPHAIIRPFNRFGEPVKKKDWFSISKINSWVNQNRLAWIPCAPLDETEPRAVIGIAQYQGIKIERDVADASRTFWGAPRQLLFEVIQDTPEIYLRAAFTRTYCGSGRVLLPEQAFVKGENQVGLQFAGSGSANVIVGPIKPGRVKGKALVSLDFGMPAQQFFEGDSRKFCGWIRDVSAMSPERYQQLVRPSSLRAFPDDLLNNPALEYSGIYEDGMLDQKSWVGLSTLASERAGLLLEGEIPLIPGLEAGNHLTLSMDGTLLTEIKVGPGRFSVFVMLPVSDRNWARFEMKWAKASHFPGGDERPIAARLRNIGIMPVK